MGLCRGLLLMRHESKAEREASKIVQRGVSSKACTFINIDKRSY